MISFLVKNSVDGRPPANFFEPQEMDKLQFWDSKNRFIQSSETTIKNIQEETAPEYIAALDEINFRRNAALDDLRNEYARELRCLQHELAASIRQAACEFSDSVSAEKDKMLACLHHKELELERIAMQYEKSKLAKRRVLFPPRIYSHELLERHARNAGLFQPTLPNGGSLTIDYIDACEDIAYIRSQLDLE